MSELLIYGANGYTGELIARTCSQYGITPLLSGRSETAVREVGARHGFECRPFPLEAASANLSGIRVVLNCAGPFSRTWEPMVRACIANGVHYIDITGEIAVFEGMASLDRVARDAGVMLLPGAGFDVVPTDCLASHVSVRLPDAKRLHIGIFGSGRLSRGTMTTALEKSGAGGQVRRGGRIIAVPAAWRTRDIDFGKGPVRAVTIPWGDVATAFYSTGIPDIDVYAGVPHGAQRAMRISRYTGWLLRSSFMQNAVKNRIAAGPAGPSERELEHGESRLWARAENDRGGVAESLLTGPNGYKLTAHSALLAAKRALNGDAPVGFKTPSLAYGADFALEVPGTARHDVV